MADNRHDAGKQNKDEQKQQKEEKREEGSRERDDEPQHRHTTFAMSKEDRRASFQIEDERWQSGRQLKDWGILAAMILIYLSVSFLIFIFEPGLR